MNYKLPNGKTVRIPDAEIEKNARILSLTKEEAIQMYLEDNGYAVNEEQEALTKKAKENRITATIHQAKAEYTKKTQKERVHKDDPTKEGFITALTEFLKTQGAENVTIVKQAKLISFDLKGENFKLDLIRTRAKKEGGK